MYVGGWCGGDCMIQLCSDYHISPDFCCGAGAVLPIVLRTLGIIMLHNLHLDQYKDSFGCSRAQRIFALQLRVDTMYNPV